MLSKLTIAEQRALYTGFPETDFAFFRVVARCSVAAKWSPPAITVKKASNFDAFCNLLLPFDMESLPNKPLVVQLVVDTTHVLLVDSRIAPIVELAETVLLEAQSCDPIDPQDYAKKFTRWSNSAFSCDAAYDSILFCSSVCEMHTSPTEQSGRLSPPIQCVGANDTLNVDALEGSLFEWWARAAEYFDLGVCDSFEKSLQLAAKHVRPQNFVPRLFGVRAAVDDTSSDANAWSEHDKEQAVVDTNDLLLFAMDEDWPDDHSVQHSVLREAMESNSGRATTIHLLQTWTGRNLSLQTELASHDAQKSLSAPPVATARCFAQVMFPVATLPALPIL